MCGIFGFDIRDGAITNGQRAILSSALAYLNDKRGGQSWGLLGYDQELSKLVIKRGLGEMSTNAFKMISYNRMFGHSRQATHGTNIIDNAHPFKIDRVIGAHNGVIYNHEELNRKYNRSFAVDSMHLFAHINEKHDFSDLRGYGSIEWWEKGDQSFKICKLSGGSLSVCVFGNEKADGVIWSSDNKHLEEAVAAAGISNAFALNVEEGRVYSVFNNNINMTSDRLELQKLSTTSTTYNYKAPSSDIDADDMTELMKEYLMMSPPNNKEQNVKALPESSTVKTYTDDSEHYFG